MDESWIDRYTSQVKSQSADWVEAGGKPQKRFKQAVSPGQRAISLSSIDQGKN